MKNSSVPRPEYPRMQFRRENSWLNLNGKWDFHIDRTGSARERGIVGDVNLFDRKITVPFCPESKLSGVADTDFMNAARLFFPRLGPASAFFCISAVWITFQSFGLMVSSVFPTAAARLLFLWT